MRRRAVSRSLLLLLATFSILGCAAKRTVYLDRQADFESVRRVAVLPFQNMTKDSFAGEKVRRIFIIELLAQEVVEVVDPGEVALVLREQRIDDVESMGPEKIATLAEAMKVDALIFGSVQELGLDRSRQVSSAQVSITCRMLDAGTGAPLWSAAASRGGAGAMSRLFGVSGDTVSEAARKMVRQVIKTLVD